MGPLAKASENETTRWVLVSFMDGSRGSALSNREATGSHLFILLAVEPVTGAVPVTVVTTYPIAGWVQD